MTRPSRWVLLSCVLGALPATAAAQALRPEFNFGLGPTVPSGWLADHNPVGYNLTLGLGARPEGWPVAVRVEALYDEFHGNSYVVVCGPGADCSRRSYIAGGTVNLVFDRLLPRGSGTRRRHAASTVYAIGGFGLYGVHAPGVRIQTPAGYSGYSLATRSYTGWNLGGGIRFPMGGSSIYVEARVHALETGARFVPITVGLIF
jgi:hypothetical protein